MNDYINTYHRGTLVICPKSQNTIYRSEDDKIVSKVFRVITDCDDEIVRSVAIVCKRRAISYFELVSFLFKSMSKCQNNDTFKQITLAAIRLGNAMETEDNMFCDYAMPLASFQRLLASSSHHRRQGALNVLKSFVSSHGDPCLIYWDLDQGAWRMAVGKAKIKYESLN